MTDSYYTEQFELERMALLDTISGLEIENGDLKEELEEILQENAILAAQLDHFYKQGESDASI